MIRKSTKDGVKFINPFTKRKITIYKISNELRFDDIDD